MPLQVEVVGGGDDSAKAGSPPQGVPLVDLRWVDPKVAGISFAYLTEAYVSMFWISARF